MSNCVGIEVSKIKAFVLKRPLFTACAVAFAVSYICRFLDSVEMLAMGGAIFFAFLFILPFKTELKSVAFITVIVCNLMIISNALYYHFMYKPVLDYVGMEATVQGEVIEVTDSSVTVRCESITVDNITKHQYFKARFTLKTPIDAMPSAQISLTACFYDKSYRASGNGIHILGDANNLVLSTTHNPKSIRFILFKIRENIRSFMPFDTDSTNAFMNGIIFGDVSEISGIFKNKMNSVGLSHVTSVSGMHLAFSVVLLDMLLAFLAVGYKKRAAVAILSILGFGVVSGFAISCIRASIMIILYYIGILTGKISDSLTSLSLAVYLILLFSPDSINSLSLLLSASSTFGIIVFSPCFNKFFKFNIQNGFLRAFVYGISSLFTLSLSASLCCLPITAILFKKICVISPVVNVILAVPFQVVFYVGILGIVFGWIPFISDFISLVGDLLYNLIEFVVSKCYYINNTVVTAGFNFYYIILALVIVVAIGFYLFYKTKRPISLSLWYLGGFCAICLCVFCVNKFVTRDTTEVYFADVGDGACSVISRDESAVIIDCGGEYYDEIERVLCYSGVKSIKLIALTHFDADHVNFLGNLIDSYDIDCIVYPYFAEIDGYYSVLKKASDNGTSIKKLKTDEELELYDGVIISWLVDKTIGLKPDNNTSAVYRVDIGDNSILYTGDMNIYQEYSYLRYSGKMNCDILSVAHHGSNTSSSFEFLTLCSPEYSVVSVNAKSKENPSGLIINRLKKISKVLLTSESSTIKFLFNKKGYKNIR